MTNSLFGYSSASDWWTKKMDPNTIRGTFNWDLLVRVMNVKKEQEMEDIPGFISNEDALQQRHEEFIKEVDKSGLPQWMVQLY